MLTPTKLIVLALILFAVWSVFKMIEKRNTMDETRSKSGGKNSKKSSSVDLQQCLVCDSWVHAPCNEENCPIKS